MNFMKTIMNHYENINPDFIYKTVNKKPNYSHYQYEKQKIVILVLNYIGKRSDILKINIIINVLLALINMKYFI